MNNLKENETLKKQFPGQKSYDYIIVGAGSAGCVIARRLLEQTDAEILVLEAGGDDVYLPSITDPSKWVNNTGTVRDYQYQYSPSIHCNGRILQFARGKILGGSGSINGMVWARGQAEDYDRWASVAGSTWSYSSVLPLFKKIEDWEDGESEFHGSGGLMHVERAKSLGLVAQSFIDAGTSYGMSFLNDINGTSPEGVGIMASNVKFQERWSPFKAYLQPILEHPNLTLCKKAEVTRLVLRGNKCVGVKFRKGKQEYIVGCDQEVILCGGTINTPKLLLLSGIGCPEELKESGVKAKIPLPGVGRQLQDHPLLAGLCFSMDTDENDLRNNLGGSAAYWKSSSRLKHPDLMLLPIQIPYLSPEMASVIPISGPAFTLLPTLVQPKSRGFLKLGKGVNPDHLDIQPNFLDDNRDLQALIEAVKICKDISHEPALKKIIKKQLTPSLNSDQAIIDFIRTSCMSYAHPVGTCAMGMAEESVVDPQLKVYGVQGLRIADASVMPNITSGNTNAPTLMIGEFASKLITTQWNRNSNTKDSLDIPLPQGLTNEC